MSRCAWLRRCCTLTLTLPLSLTLTLTLTKVRLAATVVAIVDTLVYMAIIFAPGWVRSP